MERICLGEGGKNSIFDVQIHGPTKMMAVCAALAQSEKGFPTQISTAFNPLKAHIGQDQHRMQHVFLQKQLRSDGCSNATKRGWARSSWMSLATTNKKPLAAPLILSDIAGIMLPRVQEALKREKLLEEEKRASEVQARILQAQSDFFLFKNMMFFFDPGPAS